MLAKIFEKGGIVYEIAAKTDVRVWYLVLTVLDVLCFWGLFKILKFWGLFEILKNLIDHLF